MIGITEIGCYIPENKTSNIDRMDEFNTDESFITEKLGIKQVSVKELNDNVSDMCVKAYHNLSEKTTIDLNKIKALVLITQNPDTKIPHTSAIIHKKLNLPENCACFDVSLGCSGYVYGLSILSSFLTANGYTEGLLFTCDPYSTIINPSDKNTAFLFGDAATVTLLSEAPIFKLGKFSFGTIGKESHNLTCDFNEELFMNGRGIFNFAARYVPVDLKKSLELNKIELNDLDSVIFHQGSKYIIDTLIKRIGLNPEKVVCDIMDYGNTVSSSIPILLEKEIPQISKNNIFICGFGVGLSWASTILTRN